MFLKDVVFEFFRELEEIEEILVTFFGFIVFFVGNCLFLEIFEKFYFE